MIWENDVLITLFQCHEDFDYALFALHALYYMLYKYLFRFCLSGSKECVRQFQSEGGLSELIMFVHGSDARGQEMDELQEIGKSILEKIILEGGEEILQFCSEYELLMLMNIHAFTIQLAAFVMTADLCHCTVMPVYQMLSLLQDADHCNCRYKYVNEPYMDCTAVFVVAEGGELTCSGMRRCISTDETRTDRWTRFRTVRSGWRMCSSPSERQSRGRTTID